MTGACFQPSIEDLNTKICVHALPVAEDNCTQRQYQGMPLFAEVGPLNLDSFLQAESQQVIAEVKESSNISAQLEDKESKPDDS